MPDLQPKLLPINDLISHYLISNVRHEQDLGKALQRLSRAVFHKGGLPQAALPSAVAGLQDEPFVTHDVSTALTNYLKLLAGTDVTLTEDSAAKTLTIANVGTGVDVNKRWAYIALTGIGGTPNKEMGTGDQALIVSGVLGSVNPTATEFRLGDITTGATINNQANISGSSNMFSLGLDFNIYAYMAVPSSANIRLWFAISTGSAANHASSDGPGNDYAAFRYSTAVPDTNWQCITKVSPTETKTDSGQAPSSTGKLFSMHYSGADGTVTFKIDGTQVAQHTTNLPASTTGLGYRLVVTTLTGAAKHFEMGWLYWEAFKAA